MVAVIGSREMDHAINTGKGRSSAAIAVGIEFLLRQDITAVLDEATRQELEYCLLCRRVGLTSGSKWASLGRYG
jgi:hypothetical protein